MGGERGCNGAERAAGKSRASDPIWRTIGSSARSEKAAASKYCSTSPHALSLRSPCLPPYVARRGRPPDTPSRSRCSNARRDKPPAPVPTACGNSLRSCRRCSRRPPGASRGTMPARPSVFALFENVRPQLVQFQGGGLPIFGVWLGQRFAQLGERLGLFSSQLVTVLRETPKVRESPRRLDLSW